MIDSKELKKGNWIWNKIFNRPIIVEGIRRNGEIDITQVTDNVDTYCDANNFDPFELSKEVIDSLIQNGILSPPQKENIHLFSGRSATYALIYDYDNYYFIALLLKGEIYRITRPFNSVHKLQNAFNVIYDDYLPLRF